MLQHAQHVSITIKCLSSRTKALNWFVIVRSFCCLELHTSVFYAKIMLLPLMLLIKNTSFTNPPSPPQLFFLIVWILFQWLCEHNKCLLCFSMLLLMQLFLFTAFPSKRQPFQHFFMLWQQHKQLNQHHYPNKQLHRQQ